MEQKVVEINAEDELRVVATKNGDDSYTVIHYINGEEVGRDSGVSGEEFQRLVKHVAISLLQGSTDGLERFEMLFK